VILLPIESSNVHTALYPTPCDIVSHTTHKIQ
jgi:hypothetical protein